MADQHQFIPGGSGVAAFDQQHAAALAELRGAKAFVLVIAETGETGDVQTRVIAASKGSRLLGAACCVRSVNYGLSSLQAMQGD